MVSIGTQVGRICQGREKEFRVPHHVSLESELMKRKTPSDGTTWRRKIHPAFLEAAEINRDFEMELRKIDQEFRRAMKGNSLSDERRADVQGELNRRKAKLLTVVEQRVDALSARYP